MTRDYRIYGFAIGDNIEVTLPGGEKEYYTITRVDDLIYPKTFSAIGAGDTMTFTEVTDLDPPTGMLYQINGIEVLSNVKVYIKQPAAVNRWGPIKAPEAGYLTDRNSPEASPKLISLFCLEENPPNVQIKNDTDISIAPKLRFLGWSYTIAKIAKPTIYTPLQIGGITR